MTKMFQTIRIEIVANRIDGKPVNCRFKSSGITSDEIIFLLEGALKKAKEEWDITKNKLCQMK